MQKKDEKRPFFRIEFTIRYRQLDKNAIYCFLFLKNGTKLSQRTSAAKIFLEKKERKMNMKKFLAIMMALSMMLCAFAVAETASPVASTVASPVASPVADMVGDPADLPAIAAVLNGGSEVYVPSDKTNKTLQDALNDEFTEGAGYDSFAVLDVDGDGKLDVVLNVTVNGEVLGYLVLTSADEVICAYGFYYRAMIGLKEDGSFSFSSSAAESGVATFYKDENRDAQYNELAESKLDENGNVVYFVNGEAADEDAFTAVINAQNEKADVTFVPATAENLALYLTIE